MLSEIVPAKVCGFCADATATISGRSRMAFFIREVLDLKPGNHQMSGRRAGVHDPDAALLVVVGKTERLRRGAGHRNRRVGTRALLVLAAEVVEHRAELRLHPAAVLLRRV